jgi:putative hemolysin
MLHTHTSETPHRRSRITVALARSEDDILAAQRLRYRVFAEEMGARLPCRVPGVDRDLYDAYCEHLVARDEDSGRVIGTYRILPPHAARQVGNYYSETEFDLTRLRLLRSGMVEVGRSCIDAEFRSGAVIALLWAGLAEYMQRHGYSYLIGCASIGMADGGHNAANVYRALRDHMAPVEYHVFPRSRLPVEKLDDGRPGLIPPLIKGYLRAGSRVCSEPAWDPDFNTADLFLLLSMQQVDTRYARHFVKTR